jgi:hypothetical protein
VPDNIRNKLQGAIYIFFLSDIVNFFSMVNVKQASIGPESSRTLGLPDFTRHSTHEGGKVLRDGPNVIIVALYTSIEINEATLGRLIA